MDMLSQQTTNHSETLSGRPQPVRANKVAAGVLCCVIKVSAQTTITGHRKFFTLRLETMIWLPNFEC